MKTRLFSMIGVACLAAVLSNAVAQPAAAQPQTETITFGVLVIIDPWENPFELWEGVGLNTNGIFLGRYDETAGATAVFGLSSPPCEDVVVANTIWSVSQPATIVNRGGPMRGLILADGVVARVPPERYMLLEHDITRVRACYIRLDGSNKFIVQNELDEETYAAFYIVTGEFRVEN